MSARQMKKEAIYENIAIPEWFDPWTVVIDDNKVKAFAFSTDDYCDWYLGTSSPFGGPIAHPLALANDLLFLFYQNYDGNTARGLHTHEELAFLNPVRRGERVTVTGAYTDRYERRCHGYVVLEAVARGEDGRELVRHRGIEIMRAHAGSVVGRGSARGSGACRRVLATCKDDLPIARHAAHDIPHRAPIEILSKTVTQEQMYVFSWGGRGYKNVHTSIEKAWEAGLDRTLVQAMQQTAFVTQSMVRFFGAEWFTTGHLDMRYLAPAYAGDRLTVHGAVLGKTPDASPALELEVWVTRPDGVKTAVGWATASMQLA